MCFSTYRLILWYRHQIRACFDVFTGDLSRGSLSCWDPDRIKTQKRWNVEIILHEYELSTKINPLIESVSTPGFALQNYLWEALPSPLFRRWWWRRVDCGLSPEHNLHFSNKTSRRGGNFHSSRKRVPPRIPVKLTCPVWMRGSSRDRKKWYNRLV